MLLPCDWAGGQSFLVCINDHTIFGELFLNEDDFLDPVDDEVPTRVDGALIELGQFCGSFTRQDAIGTPQHKWHPVARY